MLSNFTTKNIHISLLYKSCLLLSLNELKRHSDYRELRTFSSHVKLADIFFIYLDDCTIFWFAFLCYLNKKFQGNIYFSKSCGGISSSFIITNQLCVLSKKTFKCKGLSFKYSLQEICQRKIKTHWLTSINFNQHICSTIYIYVNQWLIR